MGEEVARALAYEDGRRDALHRTGARSEDPGYRLGYLDGLFERAQRVTVENWRDRTIGGLLFEVTAARDGIRWCVTEPAGTQHSGSAVDMEHGVAACEGVARRLGQPVTRLSSIEAMVRRKAPKVGEEQLRRIVAKTASQILSRAGHAA